MDVQGLKVLMIDDNTTICRTAETLLYKAGCAVVIASDGFDSLAKIVDIKPDVIFIDIMMPHLDGYQTCALIKNNADYKSTPGIMWSSKDGLFDKAKGRIVDDSATEIYKLTNILEKNSHSVLSAALPCCDR